MRCEMILMFNNEIFSSAQYKQIIEKYSFLQNQSCLLYLYSMLQHKMQDNKTNLIRSQET